MSLCSAQYKVHKSSPVCPSAQPSIKFTKAGQYVPCSAQYKVHKARQYVPCPAQYKVHKSSPVCPLLNPVWSSNRPSHKSLGTISSLNFDPNKYHQIITPFTINFATNQSYFTWQNMIFFSSTVNNSNKKSTPNTQIT